MCFDVILLLRNQERHIIRFQKTSLCIAMKIKETEYFARVRGRSINNGLHLALNCRLGYLSAYINCYEL